MVEEKSESMPSLGISLAESKISGRQSVGLLMNS